MAKRITLAVVVLVLVAFPVALGADHNPKFIVGSGLLAYGEEVSPPEVVRCLGGEPTGLTFPYGLPCSEGTHRIIARNEVQIWFPLSVSDDAAELLNGEITLTVNCNFNAQYRGPCWGTFTWEVPEVGTWEGHWTTPVQDLGTYESVMNMVGFGEGGEIDGKQIKLDGYSDPGDYYVTFTARIK